MAIYHMSAQVIGRSAGRSATAAAAYRAGEKIVDERTGEIHDYTRKSGVDYAEILTPANAGEWAEDRARLWNAAEQSEKRVNSQIAREINVALPRELTSEQNRELIRDYAQRNFVNQGMIADLCIHHEKGENPHAHIMLSMREAGPEGFTEKNRSWNDKEQLEKWREDWAHSCNKAMERAGVNFQIDHRTLEAQGIDRAPTKHLGSSATGMERRGKPSEKGDYNRDIAEIARLAKALEQVTNELEAIRQEKGIHESGISAAFESTKKAEQTPQSIAGFISKSQEQKEHSSTEQRTSIASVIHQPKEKPQEQAPYFPTQEKIFEAIQKGTEQQAQNVINQLREKAQDKDAKKEAENKEKGLEYKQRISEAQRAFELAQHEKAILTTEKENLGILAKLQYKAGKHELNEREIRVKEFSDTAENELIKSKRAFDEYMRHETGPTGQTYRECKQHNEFIALKAREALIIAEKIYQQRVEKEREDKERSRMKVKVRQPERGRGR